MLGQFAEALSEYQDAVYGARTSRRDGLAAAKAREDALLQGYIDRGREIMRAREDVHDFPITEEESAAWREKNKALQDERYRSKTRDEVDTGISVAGVPVRVAGSVGNFANAGSALTYHQAAKDGERKLAKAIRDMNAGEREKGFSQMLADGTITEADVPKDIKPRVGKLAELMQAKQWLPKDQIKQNKADIKQFYDDKMSRLFKDIDKVKNWPKALAIQLATPEQFSYDIFGDELGKKVYREIFAPVDANNAEVERFKSRLFDKVRKFEDSNGRMAKLNKAEDALAQRVLEGQSSAPAVADLSQSERSTTGAPPLVADLSLYERSTTRKGGSGWDGGGLLSMECRVR